MIIGPCRKPANSKPAADPIEYLKAVWAFPTNWRPRVIERIRIKNFRCLADCEIKLKRVSLLLGENGSGKSNLFDALANVREFLTNPLPVGQVFRPSDLTRFLNSSEQEFDIDIQTEAGPANYSLRIKHELNRDHTRVLQEKLSINGQPVIHFENGGLQLWNEAGPPVAPMHDQGKYSLVQRWMGTPLGRTDKFLSAMGCILIQHPCPPMMQSDSQEPEPLLSAGGGNFASWYRYMEERVWLEPRKAELLSELKEVVSDLDSIRLEGPDHGTKTMFVDIRPDGHPDKSAYLLSELSDGQRQLVLLYTLLYGVHNKGWVFLLDEPDNFLSPREIQPWLTALFDATGPTLSQSIIISHHPEVIDYLAAENAIWFTREGTGPTRVTSEPPRNNGPLRPSELLARGWH